MTTPTNTLKPKLAAGRMTRGLWVTLEAPTITEIAVELGFDWVCIDAEHGHLDLRNVMEHVRVTHGTDTTALVRIQDIQQGLIKRVLDIGAAGIVVPQVTGPDDVARAVRFAKYPPLGVRGVGSERATRWGLALLAATQAGNAETMVIPLIETAEAYAAVEAILDVPGIDALFVGPADLSAARGYLGQWEGPGVAEEVLAIKDHALARGMACGIMATSASDLAMRQQQGFRLLGVGSDTGLLIRAAREALAAVDEPAAAPEKT